MAVSRLSHTGLVELKNYGRPFYLLFSNFVLFCVVDRVVSSVSWLSIGRENGGKAKHVTHSGPIWGGVGEGRRAAKRARTPCRKTCAHPVLACAHLVFLFSGHETMLSSTQKSFGSHLGPIWVPFGSHLGPIWVPFRSHLGPIWVPRCVGCISIWVPFGRA